MGRTVCVAQYGTYIHRTVCTYRLTACTDTPHRQYRRDAGVHGMAPWGHVLVHWGTSPSDEGEPAFAHQVSSSYRPKRARCDGVVDAVEIVGTVDTVDNVGIVDSADSVDRIDSVHRR